MTYEAFGVHVVVCRLIFVELAGFSGVSVTVDVTVMGWFLSHWLGNSSVCSYVVCESPLLVPVEPMDASLALLAELVDASLAVSLLDILWTVWCGGPISLMLACVVL
jgi:hypothetical protein